MTRTVDQPGGTPGGADALITKFIGAAGRSRGGPCAVAGSAAKRRARQWIRTICTALNLANPTLQGRHDTLTGVASLPGGASRAATEGWVANTGPVETCFTGRACPRTGSTMGCIAGKVAACPITKSVITQARGIDERIGRFRTSRNEDRT